MQGVQISEFRHWSMPDAKSAYRDGPSETLLNLRGVKSYL